MTKVKDIRNVDEPLMERLQRQIDYDCLFNNTNKKETKIKLNKRKKKR